MKFMLGALQEQFEQVHPLGPVDLPGQRRRTLWLRMFCKITGKKYSYFHHPGLSKRYGVEFARRLRTANCDLIFAPAASTEIAYLKTDLPIIYTTDTTFPKMVDYYEMFSNLLAISKRHGFALEQRALRNSARVLCASGWAAKSVHEDFHIPMDRIRVAPFGANIPAAPDRAVVQARRRGEKCRLLFLGVDWKRKGGAIAFDALRFLKAQGIPATLTICGCTPPESFQDPDLVLLGYLDKKVPEQRQRLEALLFESDFLILPTRAECLGVVFCEANAYGLPSIATDTGGVGEVVRDGINGRLLPMSARGDDFGQAIAEIYGDEARFLAMAQRCRAEYDARLNWKAWGGRVAQVAAELVPSRTET